jgi:hypothetical protein
MATKTEKRHAEHHKKMQKESMERLNNLDPNSIAQLENYAIYQTLYINDAACNECRFLRGKLEKMPYKTKGVEKIYKALMKRVDAYWEMIYSTSIDKESLATLFCSMDDYMDEPISNLKKAVEEVLVENNVPYADWVASVETAYTVCHLAEVSSLELIQHVSKWSKEIHKMKSIVITPIVDVIRSMSEIIQDIHMSKISIDLNTNPKTMGAFKKLYKTFSDPNKFLTAVKYADAENKAEHRMTIM